MTFWTKAQFDDFIKDYDIDDNDILTTITDTYDEEKISQKIKKIGVPVCCAIALQLSIVGFGNKTFGSVTYKSKKIDIQEFFDSNKILYKSKFNDKLESDDVTPRRLIRFFRYQIHEYIKNKNIPSYLYKKYCYEKNEILKYNIYPGIEYIINPEDENSKEIIENLRKSYLELDKSKEINVSERLNRILITRGFK